MSIRILKPILFVLASLAGVPAMAAPVFELSERCEVAIAASALPDHLQSQASVWVLGEDGFVQVRDGSGPFHCFVDRNHEHGLIPQCLDEPGVRSIEPRFMRSGELIRSAMSYDEIAKSRSRSRSHPGRANSSPPTVPASSK